MNLDRASVEAYLTQRFKSKTQILSMQALGDDASAADHAHVQLKTYGYGKPVLIHYRVGDRERRAVLRTMAPNAFGHERRADRAAGLLLSYDTFNDLERHVRALDLGVLRADGQLASLDPGDEFFLLTDYATGVLYAEDLKRVCATGHATDLDVRRAVALATYLATIHAVKRDEPVLYRRAARDLLGSGEGIMGLTDSYPPDFALVDPAWLERVEHACVRWRWQLKRHARRLTQIHGDFHPFNILFDDDTTIWLLDRSRGGWGDPADDVSCMAINYLFFSLQRSGRLAPPFTQLWDVFWQTYMSQTEDQELLAVIAPFFVWRALVLASPHWYNVSDTVRVALFHFIDNILAAPAFDPTRVNRYLDA
jgi:aminoglycoside phosphotransferase (APT) family kinase protein